MSSIASFQWIFFGDQGSQKDHRFRVDSDRRGLNKESLLPICFSVVFYASIACAGSSLFCLGGYFS